MLPLAILINTPPSSSQTSFHTWDVPAPQTASPVFTRRDNVGEQYSDWLIAKMWVRVADVHYHIVGSLITSRLLAEMASLSILRCLPSVHPVISSILRLRLLLGPISITAARCVAWTIARHATPRNATHSGNGNRPLSSNSTYR